MGHTLVSSFIQLFKSMKEEMSQMAKLDEIFFNTTLVRANRDLGIIFRGLARQKAGKIDSAITDSLRNKLFKENGSEFGSDLAALNIQRGKNNRGKMQKIQNNNTCSR